MFEFAKSCNNNNNNNNPEFIHKSVLEDYKKELIKNIDILLNNISIKVREVSHTVDELHQIQGFVEGLKVIKKLLEE
jgi:hypothetical protein